MVIYMDSPASGPCIRECAQLWILRMRLLVHRVCVYAQALWILRGSDRAAAPDNFTLRRTGETKIARSVLVARGDTKACMANARRAIAKSPRSRGNSRYQLSRTMDYTAGNASRIRYRTRRRRRVTVYCSLTAWHRTFPPSKHKASLGLSDRTVAAYRCRWIRVRTL